MIVSEIIDVLKDAKVKKKKAFICGNGGSYCNALHFAEDLESKGIRAVALGDVGFLTATANDISYDKVFSRPLFVFADYGDILFTLSTSGASKNILDVQYTARQLGVHVFPFPMNIETGKTTPRTEEVHLALIHD